ncbi:hypothetical protein CMV_020188 [Castanea mollissima]|uniref:Uncharacterized protein n=1 Tax=Castanea mollissima TaxID=60419 RepID=A0A8J4QWZ3_9ROSI|nr:hypothetical protein CMV_020188 [Castanea mollissima]
MQPKIIEIPPPFSLSSNMRKQKRVILHYVIDVDKEEDSDDVMFIDEKVHKMYLMVMVVIRLRSFCMKWSMWTKRKILMM